jgi:hypothetical protein
MSHRNVLEDVKEMIERVGKKEARRLLAAEGVSPHTVLKIVGGTYNHDIGLLLVGAIRRAVANSKLSA